MKKRQVNQRLSQLAPASRRPAATVMIPTVVACAGIATAITLATSVVGSTHSPAPVDSDGLTVELHQAVPTVDRIDGAMTEHDAMLQQVSVEPDHPLKGTVQIVIDDTPMTLRHWAHPVRSEGLRVSGQQDDGSLLEIAPAPPRTIRGELVEQPGSIVAGSLLDGGLHAGIFLPDGRSLWIEPAEGVATDDGWHLVSATSGLICDDAARQLPIDSAPPLRSNEPPLASAEFDCEYAKLAVDADYQMFQQYGQNEQAVIDRIEMLVNAINVQYENEVGIIHEISEIIVRTSPGQNPYTTNNPSMLLEQFKSTWNSEPEASIERDLATLFTGRNLDGGVVALSFIGTVCDVPNAYGLLRDLNMDFVCMSSLLSRHLALMWNATTCDCPETTMHMLLTCSNTFIGPGSNTVNEILAFKESLDCLESCEALDCATADLNCDGIVDGQDLLLLLSSWGECADEIDCPADLNNDGTVDGADLLILLSQWG